jgi:preprotein translocase subunit SecF
MRLIRYFPVNTSFDFMRFRKPMLLLSVVVIVLSLVLLAARGLNYGIDFKGGLLLEIRTAQPANLGALRSAAAGLNLGETTVQQFGGSSTDVLLRLQVPSGVPQEQAVERIKQVLPANTEFRRIEFVGPAVGKELVRKGVASFGFSLLAIFIYLWLRFEWQFGLGAIVAVLHDVASTIGLFVLTGMEFNLTTVAAVLTIAGYSVNDTVVVYDRVRDNLRKYKKMGMVELINRSLNETLSRTLLTSSTTLVALLCLYFLGGDTLQGFCLAMIWGIVVGTYSSVFIAVPLLLYLGISRTEGVAAEEAAARL